jgi:hypothetical protein
MNLIQQAVERAGQMEREGQPLPSALRHAAPLHGVQSRSFRPTPMAPSRVPWAAAGLAVLAVVGGASLYVALVQSQGLGADTAAISSPAHTGTPAVVVAKAALAVPAPAPAPATTVAPTPPPPPQAAAPLPSPPAPPEARDLGEARATLESWARAWSERDVSGYLAHYGTDFKPDRGASRSAWEKSRRQMIARRSHIAVSIADLRLEQVSDKRIVARYLQDYAADTYRETGTPKRLVLERESTGWRIVAETAEPAGGSS